MPSGKYFHTTCRLVWYGWEPNSCGLTSHLYQSFGILFIMLGVFLVFIVFVFLVCFCIMHYQYNHIGDITNMWITQQHPTQHDLIIAIKITILRSNIPYDNSHVAADKASFMFKTKLVSLLISQIWTNYHSIPMF